MIKIMTIAATAMLLSAQFAAASSDAAWNALFAKVNGTCIGQSGMAIFALASLLCGIALSPWSLIASRALQGIGAALMMPQVYASLRLLFDGDERRRAFAVMGAVQGIAGAASQLLGGGLMALDIGSLDWRLIFFVNLPIAAYALIAGKWFIVETRDATSARLDLMGALLGASALTAILLPAMVGQEQHWPWWTILGLLLSVPLFAAFIAYENRVRRLGGIPIIDPSLFKKNGVALGMKLKCRSAQRKFTADVYRNVLPRSRKLAKHSRAGFISRRKFDERRRYSEAG